ncbi:MAG: hypothetical protein ACT4NP_11445 [Pseudonocardiales bacterium]
MSDSMRATVRSLAEGCPVCVVSGRDRVVVPQLMGLDIAKVTDRQLVHAGVDGVEEQPAGLLGAGAVDEDDSQLGR